MYKQTDVKVKTFFRTDILNYAQLILPTSSIILIFSTVSSPEAGDSNLMTILELGEEKKLFNQSQRP